MLKQRDQQTVTRRWQWRRRWAGPAGRLGGLGGGLPPCTLASWLVLKCWLKITLIVWELLLQQGWLWLPRGQTAKAGTTRLLGFSAFGSSSQLATAAPVAH